MPNHKFTWVATLLMEEMIGFWNATSSQIPHPLVDVWPQLWTSLIKHISTTAAKIEYVLCFASLKYRFRALSSASHLSTIMVHSSAQFLSWGSDSVKIVCADAC